MPRPIVLALVVASRFGLLLGLALWLGLGAAALLALTAAAAPQGGEAANALLRRIEGVLFGALGLVLVALTARTILDRAAPPTSVILPVAAMTLSPPMTTVVGANGATRSIRVTVPAPRSGTQTAEDVTAGV